MLREEATRRMFAVLRALRGQETAVDVTDQPSAKPAEPSPWNSDELGGCRSESALSLLDDDVVGYLLLTFHTHEGADYLSTRLSHVVGQEWWPLVGGLVAELVERNAV